MLRRAIKMMKEDISYGVVPVRKVNESFEVLLCKSRRHGYFNLAKGHKDPGETEIQGAIRELLEETGHRPLRFWADSEWTYYYDQAVQIEPIDYYYKTSNERTVHKTVKLYIAEVEKESEILDLDEVEQVEWFPANEETASLLHFKENIQHFIDCVLPKLS